MHGHQLINSCHLIAYRSGSKLEEVDWQEVQFAIRFKEKCLWLSRTPAGGTELLAGSEFPDEEREFEELLYRFAYHDLSLVTARRMLRELCIDRKSIEGFASEIAKFAHELTTLGIELKRIQAEVKVVHLILDGGIAADQLEQVESSKVHATHRIEPPLSEREIKDLQSAIASHQVCSCDDYSCQICFFDVRL